MTQRPSFRQIAAPIDVDDGTLDRLSEKLGMPALVKPATEMPSGGQKSSQGSPKAPPFPAAAATAENAPKAKKPAPASFATRGPVEKMTIELPGYLTDALKREALDRHVTARHLVILGLQAIGLAVEPPDLVPDARRVTRKPGRP